VNGAGAATSTGTASVTLQNAPAVPTFQTVTAVVRNNNSDTVTLTWTDNSANETGFTIQRAGDAAFTIGLNTTTIVSTTGPATGGTVTATQSVPRGVTYYYRINAFNLPGPSAWSATKSVAAP
jgi:hypothetical protein